MTLRIYRLGIDANYRLAYPTDSFSKWLVRLEPLAGSGRELISVWPDTPQLEMDELDGNPPIGTFSGSLHTGLFMMNTSIREVFSDAFGDCGEYLPVSIIDWPNEVVGFNVTKSVPFINHNTVQDINRSSRDPITSVNHDNIPLGALFRDSGAKSLNYYTAEIDQGPKGFVSFIEEHGFTGMRYDLVWEGSQERIFETKAFCFISKSTCFRQLAKMAVTRDQTYREVRDITRWMLH